MGALEAKLVSGVAHGSAVVTADRSAAEFADCSAAGAAFDKLVPPGAVLPTAQAQTVRRLFHPLSGHQNRSRRRTYRQVSKLLHIRDKTLIRSSLFTSFLNGSL